MRALFYSLAALGYGWMGYRAVVVLWQHEAGLTIGVASACGYAACSMLREAFR